MAPAKRSSSLLQKWRKWSLVFDDPRLEQGFLQVRKTRLQRSIFFAGAMGSVFGFVAAVHSAVNWLPRYPLIPEIAEAGINIRKVLLARAWVIIFCFFAALVALGVGASHRVFRLVSMRQAEALVIAICSLAGPVLCVITPWYMAKVLGEDVTEIKGQMQENLIDEGFFAMTLDVLVTCSFFFFPLRCCLVWVVGLSAWLSYIIPAAIYGSTDVKFTFWNGLLLSLLFLASLMGHRATEELERRNFLTLIAEREQRYKAQFALDIATKEQKGKKRRTADELSVATTTETDLLWAKFGSVPQAEGLAAIADVGMREHWVISPSQLRVDKPPVVLGTGSFGMVLAGSYFEAPVALKLAKRVEGFDAKRLSSVAQELRVLRHVRHPFIVSFHGACIDLATKDLVIVLERLSGTSLATMFRMPFLRVAMEVRVRLMKEVCGALQFMHNHHPRIVHGDLKGSNVLAEPTGNGPIAKLVDFGLSRLLTSSAKPLGGTPKYMAPEALLGRETEMRQPKPSADVFSFGRMIFLAVTGRLPLERTSMDDLFQSARAGETMKLDWPESGTLIEEARMLVDECCEFESADRPAMDEVCQMMRDWPGAARAMPTISGSALAGEKRAESVSLHEHLQLARAGTSNSSSKAFQPEAELAPPEVRKVGGWRPRLARPDFQPTPYMSMEKGILSTLRSWNVWTNVSAQCCPFHDVLQCLDDVRQGLLRKSCDAGFGPEGGWQCPCCLVMESVDFEADSTSALAFCRLCGHVEPVERAEEGLIQPHFASGLLESDGSTQNSEHSLRRVPL